MSIFTIVANIILVVFFILNGLLIMFGFDFNPRLIGVMGIAIGSLLLCNLNRDLKEAK